MATLSAQDQSFVHAYSKLLVEAWTDPSFKKLLTTDPTAAARNAGLPFNAGSTVVVQDLAGAPDIDQQLATWAQGDQSGTYVLYVPDQPQLGMQTASTTVGDTSYCCCCCPCCTCT
jgi:hypothetical protein